MKLYFFGTSAAIPTKSRNLPSIGIVYDDGSQIILDAGEDLQRRFEQHLKFNQPLVILISHLHGDHVIGLPGLLFHFSLIHRERGLIIIGPRGLFGYLMIHKYFIGLKGQFLSDIYEFDKDCTKLFKYNFQEDPQQKPEEIPINNGILYENSKYLIRGIPMEHSMPTVGFRFEEKPRRGKFNPERAIELGIPRGPLWGKLQSGEIIQYNNKTIDPVKEKIIGKKRKGIVISYSGDTKICPNLFKLAKDSDIFICESTYAHTLKDLALEKKHMTSVQAAQVAKDSNVKKLI